MAIQYRERPHVRKWIVKYLQDNPHISLEDMAKRYYVDSQGLRHNLYFTDGMRTQARKMLQERDLCTTTPQNGKVSTTDFDRMLREHQENSKKQVTPLLSQEHSAEENKSLCFEFVQTGKLPTIGILTAVLYGKVILIDTLNIATYNRRWAYYGALRSTNQVPSGRYPSKDLPRCLLDIAEQAMSWPDSSQCRIKHIFKRSDT